MNDSSDNAFFNFVLIALVVVAVLAGVFYACSYLMPVILFYVLPFLAASLFVGLVMWFLVQNGEDGFAEADKYTGEKRYSIGVQFKTLALIIPALVCVTFLVFEVDSSRKELVDKKGNVVQVYLKWPKANDAFNGMRAGWYRDSMFESLRAKARESAVYDRSEIGNIFWMALIFGGPGLFFWLTRDSDRDESVSMTKAIKEKVEKRESQLQVLIAEQEQIVRKRQRPLEEQITKLERRVSELSSENQLLKAKMEFGVAATTVKAAERKAQTKGSGGVLDGEML